MVKVQILNNLVVTIFIYFWFWCSYNKTGDTLEKKKKEKKRKEKIMNESWLHMEKKGLLAHGRPAPAACSDTKLPPAPHGEEKENKTRPPPTNSSCVEDRPCPLPAQRARPPPPRAQDSPHLSPHRPLKHPPPPQLVPTESNPCPAPAQRRKATPTCTDLYAPISPTQHLRSYH